MDYNFIKSSQKETDIELFFGPITADDKIIDIEGNTIMAHLLFAAGVFQSVSLARKNGWNKPIPKGFTDFRAGKSKTRITILNEA